MCYLFDLFDEDEDLSHPEYTVSEIMQQEDRSKILAKAGELVSAFSEIAVPYGCNCIGTISLSADEAAEMMRRENPQWFESGE